MPLHVKKNSWENVSRSTFTSRWIKHKSRCVTNAVHWFGDSFLKWKLSWSSSLCKSSLLRKFGTHQQRKYFACKGKHLSFLKKKKKISLEWSVHSGITGYLTPVSPGWEVTTKSMSVFEESVWERSEASHSLPQINAVGYLLIQPVKSLLDLISVKSLCISSLVALWPLRLYFFNEPAHVIFAYPACVPVCRH